MARSMEAQIGQVGVSKLSAFGLEGVNVPQRNHNGGASAHSKVPQEHPYMMQAMGNLRQKHAGIQIGFQHHRSSPESSRA